MEGAEGEEREKNPPSDPPTEHEASLGLELRTMRP